jgi:hypothetical protein
MLALSSASLVLREGTPPAELCCFDATDADESSRESLPKAWSLLRVSCVVALEMSCGLDGDLRIECDVVGRELRNPSWGRGGSGGGVPSRDGNDTPLVELRREALVMMFSVGFAKSCCSTRSAFFAEALLLFCVGVEGVLDTGEDTPSGSALPVSGIKAVVAVPHQGNMRRGSVGDMAGTRLWTTRGVTLSTAW